jgi:hypothetical protein
MGKRDQEQLGAYLIDRLRGQEHVRPPEHRDAPGLAATADAAALNYEQLDGEGDQQGSKYTLMRFIERDVALWEERQMRRGWVFSFAAAAVCTIIFSGLVLGAYILGTQQGVRTAAGRAPSTLPANVVAGGRVAGPTLDTGEETGLGTHPVPVEEALPRSFEDWSKSQIVLIADLRATALRNGADPAEVNDQTSYLADARSQLTKATAMSDPSERKGAVKLVVENLAAMEGKFPAANELTVWGLSWAAQIARSETGDPARAQELYGEVGRMCEKLLTQREGSPNDQSYLRIARDNASFNYGMIKELGGRDAALARPSPGEGGGP